MATRTIEVSEETYDRLKFEQRSPDETWDDVLSRALGPGSKHCSRTTAEVPKSLETNVPASRDATAVERRV